jgi:hypothetical protein
VIPDLGFGCGRPALGPFCSRGRCGGGRKPALSGYSPDMRFVPRLPVYNMGGRSGRGIERIATDGPAPRGRALPPAGGLGYNKGEMDSTKPVQSGPAAFPRVDRCVVTVARLGDPSDEKAYWLSKTSDERIEAMEIMRQIAYGYDPATTRLQRVLEITERA